jgi:hypothetical protein
MHHSNIKNFLLYAGIILPAGLMAQGIYVLPGAHLVMNAQPQLVLNNAGFTNNGTFASANSTVWFTGNDATRTGFVGGSNSSNLFFYNITIARQAGEVQLQQNISVTNSIRMSTGNLNLKSYNMNLLYASVISGESEHSYITADSGGYIQATRYPATRLVTYNPGNMGIDLTTTNNPAAFIVYRRHVPVKLSNRKLVIKRVFNITSLGNPGLTTIRFHYFDAELTGIAEPILTMYKTDSSGSFIPAGRDSIYIDSNVVVTSDIYFNNLRTSFTLGDDRNNIDQPILVTNPVAKQATTPGDTYENGLNKMQVYPVPAHDYFIITVVSERQQQSELLLFDEVGHLVQRKKVLLLFGGNPISWDISSYRAGVYYMTSDNRKMNKIKIVKQ